MSNGNPYRASKVARKAQHHATRQARKDRLHEHIAQADREGYLTDEETRQYLARRGIYVGVDLTVEDRR